MIDTIICICILVVCIGVLVVSYRSYAKTIQFETKILKDYDTLLNTVGSEISDVKHTVSNINSGILHIKGNQNVDDSNNKDLRSEKKSDKEISISDIEESLPYYYVSLNEFNDRFIVKETNKTLTESQVKSVINSIQKNSRLSMYRNLYLDKNDAQEKVDELNDDLDKGGKISVCDTCDKYFYISSDSIDFLATKGYDVPKRCERCRKRRNSRYKKGNIRGKRYAK